MEGQAERKEGNIKGMNSFTEGGGGQKLDRDHAVTKCYNFCISQKEIYKNISSSDLIEESFSRSNCLFITLIANLLWSIYS